jgi:acetyl-CoA carboxylase carboxyl transferase subunit alpha
MKITAQDLFSFGICDKIIEEAGGGAKMDKLLTARNIEVYVKNAVKRLAALNSESLPERRYQKFRKIGVFREG